MAAAPRKVASRRPGAAAYTGLQASICQASVDGTHRPPSHRRTQLNPVPPKHYLQNSENSGPKWTNDDNFDHPPYVSPGWSFRLKLINGERCNWHAQYEHRATEPNGEAGGPLGIVPIRPGEDVRYQRAANDSDEKSQNSSLQ